MEAPAQRFGPYVILDRIGDGGMAEIFLAKVQGYSGFEKLIALKKIHPRYSRNPTFAQMLIHEAKLAASLNHFNVVQVLDLGEIDQQVYIAMEYVRGRDLAAVLSSLYRAKERLPLELTLFVATEFLTGLEYAHRMLGEDGRPLGLIHRDISPQNVLISHEGEVKVTDFGIARVISEKAGFQLPGNLHGKYGYMSPEQARNRTIDQRSDLFSAGVVLWEMLVGSRLFRGRDHPETLDLVLTKPVPPPSSLSSGVPPEVDHIVAKALAREPEQRYQTMGALLGDLSRVAASLPRRTGSRDLSVYMRRKFGAPNPGSLRPGAPSAAPEPPMGKRLPLGQILLERGVIDAGQLEIGLAEQRAKGGRLGEVLLEGSNIDGDVLADALASQLELPHLATSDLLALEPPADLLDRFPRTLAESGVLPLGFDPAGLSVRLALADPEDERLVLEAKVLLGVQQVTRFVAPRAALVSACARWYGAREAVAPPVEVRPAPEPVPTEVLIADADPSAAHRAAARLRDEGWRVDVVHDGRSARAALRNRRWGAAVLDAALPGIDGYNLLLEVRASGRTISVFLASERSDEFRESKALELGADGFFEKPISLELLASKLRRELQRKAPYPSSPGPSAGVSGSLEHMSMLDVARSLGVAQKTAHVVLQYEDGRHVTLRFDSGILRGAACGPHFGRDALLEAARPGPGLFRIEYRASPVAENLPNPEEALCEAEHRAEAFSPMTLAGDLVLSEPDDTPG